MADRRTPVLDSLTLPPGEALRRTRAVGGLLVGGSGAADPVGRQLLQEYESGLDEQRRERERQATAGDALRRALAGGRGRGEPADDRAKPDTWFRENYPKAIDASNDLRELYDSLQAYRTAHGNFVSAPKKVLASFGKRFDPELGAWMEENLLGEEGTRLARVINRIDARVRNKLYGSALTAPELAFSVGNMLGGAMSDQELFGRIEDSMAQVRGNLEMIDQSYRVPRAMREGQLAPAMEPFTAPEEAPAGSVTVEPIADMSSLSPGAQLFVELYNAGNADVRADFETMPPEQRSVVEPFLQ